MKIKRGEIYLADLNPTVGSEIRKTRPVIVVSNDINNQYANTITGIPVTSQKLNKIYPFEVLLPPLIAGLKKPPKAKADQIRTLDKTRLTKKLGQLDLVTMMALDAALRVHLDL